MKWILVTLLAIQLAITNAYPGESVFEIEKQRLVKFPEEAFRYEDNEQKSTEAKRILEEINKINVALGYVKKQESHSPSILDSNQFLFPKPSYHPFHSQNNGGLQPSIRKLNLMSKSYPIRNSPRPKSIETPKPELFFHYYIPETIVIPSKSASPPSNFAVPVKLSAMTKDEYIKKNSPRQFKLIDYKVVGDVDVSHADKKKKVESDSPQLRLYFVPREMKLNEKAMDYSKNEKLTRIEKLPTIRPPFSKTTTEKQRPNTKSPVTASLTSTTTLSPPISSLKTPFASFFKRPANVIATQKVEVKPVLQSVPLSLAQSVQQIVQPEVNSNDDYKWDSEDSSEESDYPQEFEKHIFSAKRKEMAEVQKEALKESGIIIQRLKVRKGGIAIAGPGGVATAGSGGTAIVGPGGYALTHPRSLTIAGPGAKVIAIPESTDLKDALLRTNSGKSYVGEGEIVATGPVIYYSPDNNSEVWKTASLNSWGQAPPFLLPSAELLNPPPTSKGNLQLLGTHNKVINAVAPTQPNPWTTYSGLFLNPYPYSYLYSPNFLPPIPTEYQAPSSAPEIKPTKTTVKPMTKFPESTTRLPNTIPGRPASKNDKLTDNNSGAVNTDSRLISAVKDINPTFVIQNIIPVPGTRFLQLASEEKFPKSKESKPKKSNKSSRKGAANIRVEAIGDTASGKSVPNIPFGSYFLPYSSSTQSDGKKIASLILQPRSQAIVGNGGTAISAPISRAVLKKGVPTNVFFGPESVAIAGAGGRAHAQADLILDIMEPVILSARFSYFNIYTCDLNAIYNRRKRSVNRNGEVVSFPYYGGLKGHSLNVHKDGKINTVVLLKPQYPEGRNSFDSHFNKIQEAAARLVAIQEIAKQKGAFSQEDNKFYADSLLELGVAAQSLAQLQQNGDIKDFSKLLQGSNTQNKPQLVDETPLKPVTDAPNQTGGTFMPVSQDDPYEDFGDSVSVNAPKKDASVAEAKPVGLSIAGEGGVASSKPHAVAIAGREGLAVASPRATAIAGVSPEEAAAFSVNVPSRNQIIIKNKKIQGQDNTSAVVEEIKSSVINTIPNRSVLEAKSRIAAAVDDYDAVEGIIQATASDNAERHQSSGSKLNFDPKNLRVYNLPAKFGNRFFAYPGVNEPYAYAH